MSKRAADTNRIVYSTAQGRMCPECGHPSAQCVCRQEETAPLDDGIVRVGRQTKGRKGKGVTLVSGLPLDKESMKQLARTLKKKCGSGGSVKNSMIEVQGDHRDVLVAELKKLGYAVKQTGG